MSEEFYYLFINFIYPCKRQGRKSPLKWNEKNKNWKFFKRELITNSFTKTNKTFILELNVYYINH